MLYHTGLQRNKELKPKQELNEYLARSYINSLVQQNQCNSDQTFTPPLTSACETTL